MILHIGIDNDTLPDAGGGACCYGSAVHGPGRCTCWEPIYDREQAEPRTDLPTVTRGRMCPDCAFRPDSPERNGDPRFAHSEDGDLDELVESTGTFACHQGMRRRLALVHPSGARVECGPGAYDPPIVDGRAFKADGTPAELCAGLCARRKRIDSKSALSTVQRPNDNEAPRCGSEAARNPGSLEAGALRGSANKRSPPFGHLPKSRR